MSALDHDTPRASAPSLAFDGKQVRIDELYSNEQRPDKAQTSEKAASGGDMMPDYDQGVCIMPFAPPQQAVGQEHRLRCSARCSVKAAAAAGAPMHTSMQTWTVPVNIRKNECEHTIGARDDHDLFAIVALRPRPRATDRRSRRAGEPEAESRKSERQFRLMPGRRIDYLCEERKSSMPLPITDRDW
jgi:hypothetical protein